MEHHLHAHGRPSVLGVESYFHTASIDSLLLQHTPYGFRDDVNASTLARWQDLISAHASPTLLRRQHRCAVVGSSGVLTNSSLGAQIDKADHIIRMNTAPTEGFDRDVGSRTTIRVATLTAGQHVRKQFRESASTVLVYYCHVYWIGACWGYIPREPAPRLNPGLLRVAQALLRTNRLFPTSGMMSILLAMSLCERIDLFGFGTLPDTSCSKYYGACTRPSIYYSRLSVPQVRRLSKKMGHWIEVAGNYHDLDSERAWLSSLQYKPPMMKDMRLAGFDGVRLQIEKWTDPKRRAKSENSSSTRTAPSSSARAMRMPLHKTVT